jgi:uncharacterized protein YcnI
MKNRRIAVTLAVAALGALPVADAAAHVTLQPREVPAGGFTRLDVRVPNERDDAGTAKVAVQLPAGFASVSYEPEPGWTAKVVKEKIDKPIDLHGEPVDEQVDQVVFTADKGAEIQPGQFRDFGLSVAVPDQPQTLTFKAVQTYDSGEVVRWIGAPDADQPAPQVTLVAAGDGHGGGAQAGAATQTAATDGESKDEGNGLTIAALVVAALALATAALAVRRRPRRA